MHITGAQNDVGLSGDDIENAAVSSLKDLRLEDTERNSSEFEDEDDKGLMYNTGRDIIVSSHTPGKHGGINVLVLKANNVVSGTGNEINISCRCLGENGTDIKVESEKFFEMLVPDNPNLFPNRLRRTGSFNGKRCEIITATMRHFQDNGFKKKLEDYSKKLLGKLNAKGEFDLQVVTKIERGILYIYQKNLATAEVEINEAMTLAEKAENRQWLTSRCQIYLAHIYLYREDYKTALEYLERARSFLVLCVSSEDSAMLLYLRGYIYMKLAGSVAEPHESYERMAIECFDDEIMHASQDGNEDAYRKKLQFATLKKINILLRTYCPLMFNLETLEENMGEAKRLIDYFERNLWTDASPPAKLHYDMFRADYCYRSGVPERALDILTRDAKQQAKSIGHAPLIQMVESRIELYQRVVSMTQKKVVLLEEFSDESIDELLEMND